jgi:hypothetical protein
MKRGKEQLPEALVEKVAVKKKQGNDEFHIIF